jgi:hypothetical protein
LLPAADIYMKHAEFRIGLEFSCGGKRWRCTDVGTRVIIAISLEPHDVAEITFPGDPSKVSHTRAYETDDPSWRTGSPYLIAETVFDEDDIEACSVNPGG